MVENVIEIKSGITVGVNVGVSAKIQNIMHVKKVLFRILLHVVANMVNI